MNRNQIGDELAQRLINKIQIHPDHQGLRQSGENLIKLEETKINNTSENDPNRFPFDIEIAEKHSVIILKKPIFISNDFFIFFI